MKPRKHYSQNRRNSSLINFKKGINWLMGVKFEEPEDQEEKEETIEEILTRENVYPVSCNKFDCIDMGIYPQCYRLKDGCEEYNLGDELR